MSNRTATQSGDTALGVIPAGASKAEVSFTPSATIHGVNGDTRKFKIVETTAGGTVVAGHGSIQFNLGTDAPAGQARSMPFEGNVLVEGNVLHFVSLPVDGGMGHAQIDISVAYT